MLKLSVDSVVPELGRPIGDALLATHRSYLPVLQPLLDDAGGRPLVKGLAHVTGGGITENLPRILPEGVGARVSLSSWDVPPLFELLRRAGSVPDDDMLRTFNMGVGMVVAVAAGDVTRVVEALKRGGEPDVFLLGEAVAGSREVTYVA